MQKFNTILNNANCHASVNAVGERRNWLTFARLASENAVLFGKLWAEFNAMEKAEARESVRLLWVREFEHRQVYGHFLRITE